MKKILSVGILALVALAAAVFTSCSKDDEEKSSSFTFLCGIECMVESDQISSAVVSAMQNLMGSDATVSATSSKYIFNITCPESNKEAVAKKISSATLTDLDTALDKLNLASYVAVDVHNGDKVSDKLILTHEYEMAVSKFLPGTYASTLSDGSAIKIVISGPSDNKYKAAVTAGSTTYNATFELFEDEFGLTFDFMDDTNVLKITLAGDIYQTFENAFDGFTANVSIGDGDTQKGLIFKRQK